MLHCSHADCAFWQCQPHLLAKKSDLNLKQTPTVCSPVAVFLIPAAATIHQILLSRPLLSQILFGIAYYIHFEMQLVSPYSSHSYAKLEKSFRNLHFLFLLLVSVCQRRIFTADNVCFLQSQVQTEDHRRYDA